MKGVDQLLPYLETEAQFPYVTAPKEASEWEEKFTNYLRQKLVSVGYRDS